MSMQSSVEDINSVQRRVRVDLQAETVNMAFEKAFLDLQRKAQVKGFRPGKVPMNVVRKIYGKSVAADVADQLIREYLFAAIEKDQLRPVASPALEEVNLPKNGETYTFSAVIDVMPLLEIKTYKGVKVRCHNYDVTDDIVEKEIANIRKDHAKKRTLDTGAIATKGTLVGYKQMATLDGEVFAPLSAEKQNIELGANQSFPEVDAGLEGMKLGESKSIEVKIPEGFGSEEQTGKTAQVQLEVTDLEELVLPELNDEFAKDLNLETIADLRGKVKAQLETHAQDMRRRELEQKIVGQLLAQNPFEVPPAMVASVIDDMIEQMPIRNEAQKKKLKADAEFRKSLIEPAKQRARSSLLLWEVSKLENVEVSDEEIESYIVKIFFQGQAPKNDEEKELIKKLVDKSGAGLRDQLKLERSVERLIELSDVKQLDHRADEPGHKHDHD